MANKKRRHSRTVELKRQMEQEKLANEKSRAKNRWNPAGQALLWIDLIFLAATSLLELNGLISETAAALCLPAGNAVLLMGRMAYRGELDKLSCFLSPFPALAALVWLFSTHLEHGTEPVLMKYALGLFAALLLTLAHYCVAGFLYGKPRPRGTLFFALTGVALGITALADGPDLFAAVATAAFSLSALGFARALLAGPWPERMPPPEEEEQDG